MLPPAEADELLADLVARCIVAYECDGQEAVDELLLAQPRMAAAARLQLEALRTAGLLVIPRRPERIGRYHVRKLLGNGGMGSVWLCEQHEPIHRRVAVKLIRAGMNEGDILRRFRLEQQALAMLEHPNIARVLDAGSTDDGQPFLVMEYVAGLPLNRYCDERQLDVAMRIEIFLQVCDAVQHAHQKGILHRDLKPSNVLVTDRDGAAFPIVIDFGVAKAVGGALAGSTMLTLPGRLVGTPEYMSPEQATNEHDVDTRTDVYSLGVVLYQLLTGTLPIATSQLQRAADLSQALLASDPPTPSTRVTALGIDAARIAENRRSDVASLRRTLRGDLDWIVLKALERDRNRRYGMVGELAADLRRHQRDEPVQAARPSRFYVAAKFCRRNRLQVAAGVVVLATLAIGLGISTTFYREAIAAERDARGLAARLHGSLDTTLAAVDRIVTLGADGLRALPQSGALRSQLLEQALELHERLIAAGDGDDPRLSVALASALARAANLQFLLGRHEPAHDLLVRAEATLERHAGDALDDVLLCQRARTFHLCGELHNRRGEPEESRVHTEHARAIYEALLAKDPGHRQARLGRLEALLELSDRATATDVSKARSLMQAALPLADRFLSAGDATLDERMASLRVWIRSGWLEGETGQLDLGRRLTQQAHDFLQRTIPATGDALARRELARLLPTLVSAQIRFGDHDAGRDGMRLAIAELRPAIAANPELVSYQVALSAALFHLALLQGDREPYADVDRMQREALQLEDEAYERTGRSAERGDRYLGYLLGYVTDRIDLIDENQPGADTIDRGFLRDCMQRAETIHSRMPPSFLRDRHAREGWSQSFLARAGLLRLDGDVPGARTALAAGRLAVASLQQDHPSVVQSHRLAAHFAFAQAQLEHANKEPASAWRFVMQGHAELGKARAIEPTAAVHWGRAQPLLAATARNLGGTTPPDDIGPEPLADCAADYAAAAAVAATRSPEAAARLLAFGKQLYLAAVSRGLSAARRDGAEFEPFR